MMKKTALLLILINLATLTRAQRDVPDTIGVSFTKSIYLMFDSEPKFDFGSEDLIVRRDENKLIIQAARENFEETNLFVQVGGDIFLFIVEYTEKPKRYIFSYQKGAQGAKTAAPPANGGDGEKAAVRIAPHVDMSVTAKAESEKAKSDSLDKYFGSRCERVYKSLKHPFNEGGISYGCLVYCPAMYADADYFYVKIIVENPTNVPYDVDYLSFGVRTKKALLRKNAVQDYPLKSLYLYKPFTRIEGKSKFTMIAVFDKFTIDRTKLFTGEVWEKNGDRRITLDVDGNVFLRILPFSSL